MPRPNNLTKSVIHKLSEREMRVLLQDLVPIHRKVVTALKDAKSHLEYCGYGESWEYEVAKEQGLENQIEAALSASKELRI